ncbi:aldehyde dehydrogenase family protein [Amycolatopsis sp. NPDC101161]|uniref:aldehyde dehydrogenase family protein n=1 Tax=Amycolatopsis sp. NPDC101161 TaxID=3363940 RepID=UPI0038075180
MTARVMESQAKSLAGAAVRVSQPASCQGSKLRNSSLTCTGSLISASTPRGIAMIRCVPRAAQPAAVAVVRSTTTRRTPAAKAAARAVLDGEWGATTGFARAALLRRLGDLIGEHAERLARLEVNDSGKLYRAMIGQLTGLGGWYHYFAGLADKIEGRQIPAPNPDYLVYTRREPVGVVAAITPWNSPLLLLTWKLAPAPAAGCTVVVKPSEHSPVSTLGLAELITGRAPGRRQGRVHRVDRHRPRGRARGRREPQQGDAGAGRQVAAGGVP